MKNVNCPLCGSSSFKEMYDVTKPVAHAQMGLPGLVRKCNHCDLLYKSFDKDLNTLYNDDYADGFQNMEEYSGDSARQLFSSILSESKNRIENNGHAELLDIGSGMGTLLDTARSVGFNTTGVELSSKLAEVVQRKGHRVINKNVDDIHDGNTYDVISMMDIMEHLENPTDILKNLKKLLSDKGELVVYTPNHASMIVKMAHWLHALGMRSAMDNIFACTHTCFFTTKSLRKILEDTGYDIISTRHFQYDTSRPGQKVSVIAKFAINMIETFGTIIGLHGFRMVMYARKK
ncbi:MAG: class I SAM-dependent methyltransferase [Flavobacteriales bacterium]